MSKMNVSPIDHDIYIIKPKLQTITNRGRGILGNDNTLQTLVHLRHGVENVVLSQYDAKRRDGEPEMHQAHFIWLKITFQAGEFLLEICDMKGTYTIICLNSFRKV